MILVDSRVGSVELAVILRNLGLKAELTTLDAGDFAFEGKGPQGNCMVGVERKRIRDLLNCIDDGRFAGDQQHKMIDYYPMFRFLIVEGLFRPSPDGLLLERQGKLWVHPTGRPVLYEKLFNFMSSVSVIAGTHCIISSNMAETAHQISALFKWFQKHWEQHTSMLEVHRVALPQFTKPSFERRVASQIDGIGVNRSIECEKYFKTVPKMINAGEEEWINIVGARTAQKIVRQIHGKRE